MSSPQTPKLSVKISLSPTTYSYSSPDPPLLSLTITSNADRPITILTYNKPFHPQSGLTQNCFPIWDLTADEGVQTTTVRVQRTPLSRARGSSDEQYFLTLHPHTPSTVSTRFARGNLDTRPRSKAAAQRTRRGRASRQGENKCIRMRGGRVGAGPSVSGRGCEGAADVLLVDVGYEGGCFGGGGE